AGGRHHRGRREGDRSGRHDRVPGVSPGSGRAGVPDPRAGGSRRPRPAGRGGPGPRDHPLRARALPGPHGEGRLGRRVAGRRWSDRVNVGIGFFMGSRERDGIGWSITYLLQHLLALAPRHTYNVYTNLPAEQVSREFGQPANLRVVTLDASSFTRWEQLLLPGALRRDRIDLFHSPLGLPLLSTTPAIATIHDVCFLSCPGI